MSEIDAVIRLQWGDYLVIAIYFLLVIALGLWASCRASRSTVGEYFLAGRHINWILVGSSIFAANVGSDHFIGLAGSGAAGGIAVAGFELNALFIMVILGWLFVPVYLASGVYTMPEYLNKRFGGQRIRIYLSVLSLILTVLTKISANLFSGAVFLGQAVGWSLYPSITAILLLSCLFTVIGGLTAVMWVDAMQVVIMLFGAFVLMGLSFHEVGGYSGLVEKYMELVPASAVMNFTANASCGAPPADAMHLLRSPNADLPWPGMTIGLTILATWYFCSEQIMVQRVLAAKNFTHAKAGCILTGYLKILPFFLMVLPGMAARVLFPDKVGCGSPDECFDICGSRQGCSNIAYPLLVVKLMPHGMRGVMFAVMVASLIGALTCIFNSASTIFTIDIWLRFRPKASTVEQLITGKIFVVVLVVIGVLWIPIINAFPGSQLFNYIQSVTSFLAPPIIAVYALAIFVPRVNEMGAFWGLMCGLVVGMIRFVTEFGYPAPECGQLVDLRPSIITTVHYLHFAILLFGLVIIVTLIISLLTKPIHEKHLRRVTFWTRHSEDDRVSISGDAAADSNSETKKAEKENTIPMAVMAAKIIERQNSDSSTRKNAVRQNEKQTTNEMPKWKRYIYKICGLLEASDTDQQTHGHEIENNRHHNSLPLKENKLWRIFCDVNAVILVGVAICFWAFWA